MVCPPPVLWRRRVAPPRKRARTCAFGGRAGRAPGRRGIRAWLALLSSKNARGRPASCPRAAARRGAPPRRAAHGSRRRSALISPVACCDGRQRPPGARECVAPLVFREADWQRHLPHACAVCGVCVFSPCPCVCAVCVQGACLWIRRSSPSFRRRCVSLSSNSRAGFLRGRAPARTQRQKTIGRAGPGSVLSEL